MNCNTTHYRANSSSVPGDPTVRHTFPTGQTSASSIKALLLCLESKKGAKVADAWLTKIRLARTDLDDETRLLPLVALRDAVKAFIEEVPDGLADAAPFLVVQENLGTWARILRGTRSPQDAFARMDASESEHGRTTRWETVESGPGLWRGKVRIGHDPSLEKDGHLAKARAMELSVVPMLFGHPPAHVVERVRNDEAQEFEVTWSLASPMRGVAIGVGAGAVVGAAVFESHQSGVVAAAALLVPLLGGVLGLAWARDRARRVESGAQAVRVSALERSLALRDSEDRVAAGDLEGTVVAGQYRIGRRMGSGASGVIYEATRITDGLRVAIKLLRAASAHDVSASDRLRREAEALGLSWHPNVVEVIDHGHLPDGTSYLVMELLEGETLANRLRYKRLAADDLFPIATQVAEALAAIHAAGVVHRDLKPSNIYMVEEDGKELVKVFDFGIARVEWEEMRITNMGAPLGTPGYMSPEQESGGEVDTRSDIYALGAVLYECVVGEPPPPSFDDLWKPGKRQPSSVAMPTPTGPEPLSSGVHPASKKMPSAAPPPGDVVEVPDGWRTIIEKALAKRPEERYQDARSLLTAVRALRADEVKQTPPAAV